MDKKFNNAINKTFNNAIKWQIKRQIENASTIIKRKRIKEIIVVIKISMNSRCGITSY